MRGITCFLNWPELILQKKKSHLLIKKSKRNLLSRELNEVKYAANINANLYPKAVSELHAEITREQYNDAAYKQ